MEMKLIIFFAMIFAHIVDDYYLQGVLAKMKQKKWWQENAPVELYEHDYIVALIMHAYSWSFITSLPVFIICRNYTLIMICIILNTIIHASVDHLKANMFKINLIQDQLIHILQLLITWIIVCLL